MSRGIYLRKKGIKRGAYFKNEEEKIKREIRRLTNKIKVAILTKDQERYDNLVNLLSNSLYESRTSAITKEVLVDVILNLINWNIKKDMEKEGLYD